MASGRPAHFDSKGVAADMNATATTSAPETKEFVRRSSGLVRDISGRDALIGNMLLLNLVAAAATLLLIPFTFPGASLPLVIVLALIPSLAISAVYVLFGIVMPR